MGLRVETAGILLSVIFGGHRRMARNPPISKHSAHGS
jgi:hypothetical protein